MFEYILGFLRRHTTIENGAVLAVYGCALFYRTAFTLFNFSIIRFLRDALNDNFLLIGALVAGSNILMIFLDLPLGALQKYFKPRYFLMIATGSLFISAMIFLLASNLSLWLAGLAVLFFSLSLEIYYVVISTAVLRLSDDKTYAQNMSQQSVFDNSGKVIGLGLGGALLFIDQALDANHMIVAFSIAFLALAVTLYVYFVLDVDHYNSIERRILQLKPFRVAQTVLQDISKGVVPSTNADEAVEAEAFPMPKFSFSAVVGEVRDSVVKMAGLVRNVRVAPILVWGMIMMAGSNLWYDSIDTFEPVLVKDIFRHDTGWIADNVPRYFFESAMLILGTIIPIFFALPLGKLADWWGKWKMVVSGTLFSGVALLGLAFFHSAEQVFVLYLVMAFGFVAINPALTGLLGQEFKSLNKRLNSESGTLEDASKDDNSEGESAGIMAITINIGEIGGALLGGALLELFGFAGTFTLFGPLLIIAGIGSIFLFLKYFNKKEEVEMESLSSSSSL